KRRRPSGMSATPILHMSCADADDTSEPSRRRLPRRIGSRRASALTSVVLPAPLGPSTETISPTPTRSETSQRAGASPYATWRPAASSMGGSEISGHRLGVAHDLTRCAGGDHLPVVEHDEPITELQHRTHIVLDEQDAGAGSADATDQGQGIFDLRRRQPGEHF